MSSPQQRRLAHVRPIEGLDEDLAALMRMEYQARLRWIEGSVWASRMPRRFYKYKTIQPDSEQSVDELRDMLVESLLWMSSPESFNDPADLHATWVIEGSNDELRDRLTALVEQLEPGLTAEQRERKVLALLERPREVLLQGVQRSFAEQRRDFGVCCFAKDPGNFLMWSHYAAHHKGVCLEYEFARDVPVFARAQHVDYVEPDSFRPINWMHANDMRDAIGDTLKRKHKRWEYEGEHRILLERQACTYLPVRPDALTGLIFGYQATDPVKAKVAELLSERSAREYPGVCIRQAEMDVQAHIHIRATGPAAP